MGIGPNRMNSLTVGRITQGLACWLESLDTADPRVSLVYDTRIHSRDYARIVAEVLAANGIRVLAHGSYEPTPLLGYAVRQLGCTAGVCITASHNSREYNGYKVYDCHGVQATDEMAHAIQEHIERIDPFEGVKSMPFDVAVSNGMVVQVDKELPLSYRNAVLAERVGIDCSGLRVVYSPLGGTGLMHALHLFYALGAECSLVESQARADGFFSACPKPNPEEPGAMAPGMDQLQMEHADVFVATDPDADRVGLACLHDGVPRLISGDELGLLLFDFVAEHTRSAKGKADVAVTTVVSSPLADRIAAARGIELRRTLTGFKYIGEHAGCILREGKRFLLGFEESDGYLKGTYVRDKDGLNGLVLACELAAYYKSAGMDLVDAVEALYERYGFVLGRHLTVGCGCERSNGAADKLMAGLRSCPPAQVAGVPVVDVRDYLVGLSMPTVGSERTDSALSSVRLPRSNVLEWRLEGGSSVIVRPSGTEPKLKVYVFARGDKRGPTERLLDSLCEGVGSVLEGGTCPASA